MTDHQAAHPRLHSTTLPSPVGVLTLIASDAGLHAVIWEDDGDRLRLRAATPAD